MIQSHLANIDDPGLLSRGGLPGPAVHHGGPGRAGVRPRGGRRGAVLCACRCFGFDLSFPGYQFEEKASGCRQWGLTYHLGMDGISLLMVLLTVLLLPLCVLCSWTYISKRVKEFHISLMLMTSACVGVFVALDFVLFYIFWEAMLVPMFLLIAVWGGPERRYASLKFFLYTLAGSTLLLVAMVAFYLAGGTFSIPELSAKTYPFGFQCWTFLAMAIAFAIKVPMFPVPHLAAGGARGGPHGRQRHAGLGAAQDGGLRVPALLPAPDPGGECLPSRP